MAKVSAVVHQPPADPARFWGAVRDDVVLAAAVRGVLAGLVRDKQGSRDEKFWAYRIATVRAALDSAEPTEPTQPKPSRVRRETAPEPEPQPVFSLPERPAPRPQLNIPAVEFLSP